MVKIKAMRVDDNSKPHVTWTI